MHCTDNRREVDLLVIGAGAAGLAAAVRAWDNGMHRVLLVDRDYSPGGILRQCIHTGFGLEYFKQDLTGPEYLVRLKREVERRGIEIWSGTTAIGIEAGPEASLISQARGVTRVAAKAVILATGSYERTRENLQLAGTRPAGVFTAGQAQQLINLYGYRIGERVVIQGTGDIGLIMTRRLFLEGYEIAGVFERLPFVAGLLRNRIQCLDDLAVEPRFEHQIVEIHGASRVSGVTAAKVKPEGENGRVSPVAGTERYVPCDTVVLSAGLLPNRELLGAHRNAVLSGALQTAVDGVFAAGNAVEIHDLADGASAQGEFAADRACEFLRDAEPRYAGERHRAGRFSSRWSIPAKDAQADEVVCIVCPKGCVLSDRESGCRQGDEFLRRERLQKERVLTTTSWARTNGQAERVALRSRMPLPFDDQPAIVRSIKRETPDEHVFRTTPIGVRRV